MFDGVFNTPLNIAAIYLPLIQSYLAKFNKKTLRYLLDIKKTMSD